MIGRNDPCTCGSGKKYKKCCLKKNEATVEVLVDEELERILRGMYEQPRTAAELKEYEQYRKVWVEKLGDYWGENGINVAATEYFLFVEHQELWQQYVDEVLAGSLRDSVRAIVEEWREPVLLLGKVVAENGDKIDVKEIFGNETFQLEVRQEVEKEQGLLVFGIGLRNNQNDDNGLYTLTSFMFIKDMNQAFEADVRSLLESSKLDVKLDFYKKHMVDVYELMFNRDNTSVDDLISSKLTTEQQEVLTILMTELEDIKSTDEQKELLQNITITYFLKESPRFRKPNVLSAAVFNVALEKGMLGELEMTNREVAERFDVSTASVKTQAERIAKFVDQMVEKPVEN